MTATKPELDIEAIRARADAATPGPWVGPTYRQVLAGLATSTGGHYVDAPFIRHAREDVPALIAEVERQARVIRFVAELTRDTDGDALDAAEEVPVGEIVRALAGESL